METTTRSRLAAGLMLIVLGAGLYGMQYLAPMGESVTLTLLGGLCIAAYFYSRFYLLLVVGCVVLGLGIGSFGERTYSVVGEFTKVGLGIGFVLIYVIDLLYRRRSHWWPLIPGIILILLGFRAWRQFRQFIFSDGWPLILVFVGVVILLGALGRRRGAGRRPK